MKGYNMIHRLRELESRPHNCEWNENTFVFDCEQCEAKSDLYSQISDFYKDRWNVRPRFEYRLYTIESLQSALDFILEHCYMCAGHRRCYADCDK